MGIKNGNQVVFKMTNVVKIELDLMVKCMLQRRNEVPSTTPLTASDASTPSSKQTIIDCDVSNIIHTIGFRHSGIYSIALVHDTAKFLKSLAANTGYLVVPVLDGDLRPQSKRDAFRRRYNSTMDTINGFYCRQAAMKLASMPEDERTVTEKQKLDDLSKEAKRLDKTSRLIIPSTFKDDLETQLDAIGAYIPDRTSAGKVSEDTIKSQFESDYVIAYRIRNNISDLIYSSDADMTALCGADKLCIRSFAKEKGSRKKRKDGESDGAVFIYEITGGSNILMRAIKETINEHVPSSRIEFKDAKYPIFEQESHSPWLTALFCVGIGCDVLPGGVEGVTPLFLTKELQTLKSSNIVSSDDTTFNKLIDVYIKKDGRLKKGDILTYCQAFLYQPSLGIGLRDDLSAWNYVFHKPTSLHPYLRMFRHDDSNINIENDEGNMKKCKGINGINLPHDFLSCEGCYECRSCNECFCSTCGYSPQKDRDGKKSKHSLVYYDDMNEDICCDCYKEQRILPYCVNNIDEILSIPQMKDYLREKNKMLGNGEIEVFELQEIYELTALEECRQLHQNIDEVPFPIFPSATLTFNEQENTFAFGGGLVEKFDIKNGGQFINSPMITDDMLPGILSLFATIVRFDNEKMQGDKNKYDSRVQQVLPSQLVNFASKARVGTGYRLLKRCLRHALDPKASPIDNTKATIFVNTNTQNEQKFGLILTNRIVASMKDAAYESTIAFTCDEIVCARCECQAGASNEERVLCVHNLPLIYQLVMLLDDGLAEHILIELCSRWESGLEDKIVADGKAENVRTDILTLMATAGVDVKLAKEPTIKELLDKSFATGTQRAKRIPPAPPVRNLRPIRDVDFSSLTGKAKKRKMDEDSDYENDDNEVDEVETYHVDYYEIYTTILALGYNIESSKFPGFQVLHLRAQDTLKSKSAKMVSDYVGFKKKKLKSITNLTYQRKRPFRESQKRTRKKQRNESSSAITTTPTTHTHSTTTTTTELTSATNDSITNDEAASIMLSLASSASINPPATVASKKVTKRGPRQKCCFSGCNHTERTSKMTLVRSLPTHKPCFQTDKMEKVRTYIHKQLERTYFLIQCGKKDEGRRYWYCNHHKMKEKTVRKKIVRKHKNGDVPITITHKIIVPTGEGMALMAPSEREKKGLGGQRACKRMINEMKDNISYLGDETTPNKHRKLVDTATSNVDLVLQSYERMEELEERIKVLESHNETLKEKENNILDSSRTFFEHQMKKNRNTTQKSSLLFHLPVVTFDELSNDNEEVKRRTGFTSFEHLLSYIVILCNGDLDKMAEKITSLTWLEEWFFFFEFVWGRSITRWVDAAAEYKTNKKRDLLTLIFRTKLKHAKMCRSSWPKYVSFKEDHMLTKQKWADKFKGTRVIMWDDTNVMLLYKPGGADEQSITFSLYYGGNCAKGGVFLQLCGWIGVAPLWVGATSDSHYQEKTNIFRIQQAFAEQDKVDGEVIPFTNILDKGYRVNLPAWRAGKQLIIQPTFKTSDKKFSGRQTIHTADVATTRSGNERAVNRCKQSGFIKRGMHQRTKGATMDDVWLTWSFQTNFMYKPVL